MFLCALSENNYLTYSKSLVGKGDLIEGANSELYNFNTTEHLKSLV